MSTTSYTPDVLIVLREMAEHMRPCFVHRHEGITVIRTDPRTPRVEWLAWAIENLTVPERNVIRAAHGEPPVPARLSDPCAEGLVRPAPSMLVQDRRKPRVDEIQARFHKKMQDKAWQDLTRRLAM